MSTKFNFETPMGQIEFTLNEQIETKLASGGSIAIETGAEMVRDLRLAQARLEMLQQIISKQNAQLVKSNGDMTDVKNLLERIDGQVGLLVRKQSPEA